MNYILTGCPYHSLSPLNKYIKEFAGASLQLISVEDILSVHVDYITVKNIERVVRYTDIRCSFLRYPYDLIPPHAGSFELRENIEFLKTIALMLDSVAVNKLPSTWMLRNRGFSLREAKNYGVKIADFTLTKELRLPLKREDFAVKAVGNCFVSETIRADLKGSKFFSIEEDDGDVATILPASLMNHEEVSEYLNLTKTAFLQVPIKGAREYRGYIVGSEVFLYERNSYSGFDKSFADYQTTESKFPPSLKKSLMRLMIAYELSYLCIDVIIDSIGQEWLIDLNPFGSFPNIQKLPEVTKCMADLIVSRSKHGG